MPAYLILRFDIIDLETYGKYVVGVGPVLSSHGAELLVINNEARVLEGSKPGMNVVIKFASEEAAMAFYESPEYVPLKALRFSCTANGSCVLSPSFVMPNR